MEAELSVPDWFELLKQTENNRQAYMHICRRLEYSRKTDLKMVEEVLDYVRPDTMSFPLMVAVLRTTFCYKDKLPNWFNTFHQVRSWMIKSGLDHGRSLRGMIAPPLKS